MLAPVAIVIGLGAIYDQFAEQPVVRRAFAALAAAASAFVLTAALKIAAPMRGRWLALAIVVLTFVGDGGAPVSVAAGYASAGSRVDPDAVAVRGVSNPLLRLSLLFLQMSLLAFGGANTILPRASGVRSSTCTT